MTACTCTPKSPERANEGKGEGEGREGERTRARASERDNVMQLHWRVAAYYTYPRVKLRPEISVVENIGRWVAFFTSIMPKKTIAGRYLESVSARL